MVSLAFLGWALLGLRQVGGMRVWVWVWVWVGVVVEVGGGVGGGDSAGETRWGGA